MEAVLEPLVKSPKLNLYFRQLQIVVEDEAAKRQRFYDEITEQQKAEFINGEVVMHSPVKLEHNVASYLLLNLLKTYVTVHRLGFVGYEKILISLSRNDYEPDVCFFHRSKAKKESLEQYVLTDETYELCFKASNGIVQSQIIEGFKIPVQAIFDEEENLRVLQTFLLNQNKNNF